MAMRLTSTRSRSAMRQRMRCCSGGLALAAVHEVFAEGHQSASATGFVAGLAGRVSPRRPLVWVRQDFSEIESGALSLSGLCELGPRSAAAGDRARARHRRRVADRRRRAGLRCARRRRAGSLGAGPPARSRRQPQTHIGRGGLRRHRASFADGRGAAALDRGNKMDRARGAFAAFSTMDRLGRAGVRRATGSSPSWPGRPLDHGMEL